MTTIQGLNWCYTTMMLFRAANLMTHNQVRHTKKMSEMEVSKSETCLWKIIFCGSSTVTINHSQNVTVNIFSSGCYAHYIHYNSCTTPLSQGSPVFDLLLFHSARPFCTIVHYRVSVCSCMWTLITPS